MHEVGMNEAVVFSWRGRDKRGASVQGQLSALNENSVAQQLLAQGVVPVDIRQDSTPSPAVDVFSLLKRPSVNDTDILLFSRQMYTLSRAGVPILRAMAGLESSATNAGMVTMLKDIRAGLDQGRDIASCLGKYPSVFSPFYLAMIRVGEMTGQLTEVFLRLAEHLAFERDVRARIKQALRYPSFVVVAMMVAIVIINLFVIPVFATVFAGFKADLPWVTRALLGFSAWMVSWWPCLLGLCGAAAYGFQQALRRPAGRLRWDKFKLHIPIAGDIILKATLSRFARSFALSSQAGVPMVQALSVVCATMDNAYLSQRIEAMREGIERGESISRCATQSGVFTPVVLQMIAVGEETGELDKLLLEIAGMYERETDERIKGLSASIEPVLLFFIGLLVMVLALGVFLPLWNLGQAAMGRGGG
jgi:MSHA biogenesis protein MshG